MEVIKCHEAQINCVKKSYNNNMFATGSDDSTVRTWDFRTKKSFKLIRGCFANEAINCLVFHPINDYELSVATNDSIYTFDLRNDELFVNDSTFYFSIVDDEINDLIYTHDGRYLLVSCDSGIIQMLNPINISDSKSFNKHTNIIGNISLDYSDNRPIFVSCGFDCKIYLWDYKEGKCMNCLEVKTLQPQNVAFNPPFIFNTDVRGNNCIASIGDGSVGMYSLPNFKQIQRKEIFPHPCIEVRYINNNTILSASKNKFISILNDQLDILKTYEYFNEINMIEIYDDHSILIADSSNDLTYLPIAY